MSQDLAAPLPPPSLVLRAADLDLGPDWAALFAERWPSIEQWYIAEGEAARPSRGTCEKMLTDFMPELLPTYHSLVELAGGGDVQAGMLSMVQPPSLLSGCSQGVWGQRGGPVLVRNYDYWPSRIDGVVFRSKLLEREVIGMSDGMWGLLDGMNEQGLAASLTFGGRSAPVTTLGFGVSLVMRYVLEVCSTSAEARVQIARLPFAHAHNLTFVDASGDVLTAYVGPDRAATFRRFPVSTNHQEALAWAGQELVTRTLEREGQILAVLDDVDIGAEAFAAAFLTPPLLDPIDAQGFGTVYTASYSPDGNRIAYLWPQERWDLSFEAFEPGTRTIELSGLPPAAIPA